MFIKDLARKCKHQIILSRLNYLWRKRNIHNRTSIGQICDINCISVGAESYGILNVNSFAHTPSEDVGLEIGRYCSIADDVTFLLAGEHNINSLSTYPFERYMPGEERVDCSLSKGKIILGDDVWVGHSATILSGVTVGQGAVIAAGAVVTKTIPPYTIVGGIPAKIIKYRFSPDVINVVQHINYSKLNFSLIKHNRDLFYDSIQTLTPDELEERLKLMGVYDECVKTEEH